jgi:hypothetical protein
MAATVRRFQPVMTFEVQGVSVGRTGTLKYDPAFKAASKCMYSIYVEHQTLYDMTKFKELITQCIAPLTATKKTDEAFEYYKQLIQGLDNNPYGVFLDFNKRLPFSYTCPPEYYYNPNGKKLQPSSEQKQILDKLQKLQETFQTLFDTMPATIKSLKDAKPGSESTIKEETPKVEAKAAEPVNEIVVEETKPVAKAKAKSKSEKIEDFIALVSRDSKDFDTSKWNTTIIETEALLTSLPKTITQLEEDLAKKFDFVTKARLAKRRKELEELPALIELIKRNARAKQNYYTDNYHSSYNTFETLFNTNIDSDIALEYLNFIEPADGCTKFTNLFGGQLERIHFARHPLFRFKLLQQISEFTKIVNRIHKNKDTQVTNLAHLNAFAAQINSQEDDTKEYFVEFLERHPL